MTLNQVRSSCIAWHPDVATQLITCSDEDRCPVIQIWDLRFATAPTAVRKSTLVSSNVQTPFELYVVAEINFLKAENI